MPSVLSSKLSICVIALVIATLTACSKNTAFDTESLDYPKAIKEAMLNPINIDIHSLDDVIKVLDENQYTSENWRNADLQVPRLTFDTVGESWKEKSNNIPVKLKKNIFFRLMTPLILMSNEKILLERHVVTNAPLDSSALRAIAVKYKLVKEADQPIDDKLRQALLLRVDIIPPSLALSQAAEESGWATSRFTEEGNAFFGQWDFSGNGMAPKKPRKELGDYGLARFNSPFESVEAYMLNINTNRAYRELRSLRASLREQQQAITGIQLASTLGSYSERGEAYIEGLKKMIKFNNLQPIDEARLGTKRLLKLSNKT